MSPGGNKATYLGAAREKRSFVNDFYGGGTRSSEVQHVAEDFAPFHDPYLAATYFPLCVHLVIATICTFVLPITAFAGHGNTRQVTLTEAVWVGTRFLSAGDHEVKWDGPGLVQFSFLRGNKMIVTAPAIAAVAAGPHDPSRSHNSCDRRKLQST